MRFAPRPFLRLAAQGAGRISRTARRMMLGLVVAGAAAALVIRYEAALFPVFTDFRIVARAVGPTQIAFVAELTKGRACELVSLDMLVGDPWDSAKPRERLTLRLDAGEGSASLEPGWQRLGPFRLSRPLTAAGPMAFLRARHRCHPLWVTEGVYFSEQRDRLFTQWAPGRPGSDAPPCGDAP